MRAQYRWVSTPATSVVAVCTVWRPLSPPPLWVSCALHNFISKGRTGPPLMQSPGPLAVETCDTQCETAGRIMGLSDRVWRTATASSPCTAVSRAGAGAGGLLSVAGLRLPGGDGGRCSGRGPGTGRAFLFFVIFLSQTLALTRVHPILTSVQFRL